jgi:cyclophilin family peptidyl-prolyl cis-trans isomerase/HEAT repeat protein/thiol-disulfide isomerase/thioredoxin
MITPDMRKLLLPAAFLLALACTTTAPPPSEPEPAAAGPATPYGLTLQEEAQILEMEDRRDFNPELVAKFAKHENALHRVRIALALARIGPQTFIDKDGNGVREPGFELQAGVEELRALGSDPDRRVREMVAFALGEIGDESAVSTLLYMTSDTDLAVAAEAAEAMSKLASLPDFATKHFARYEWLTRDNWPEGVRARAVRYLFRFNTDAASEVAKRALESTSSAVRQEAAYALARRAYAPAQQQLQLLLSDPNVLTRAYAAQALGRIGDAASAPLLVTLWGDAHPWVRTNSVVAFARIADRTPAVLRHDDVPRLIAITEDPDPGVRASAIDTLVHFAGINATARKRMHDVISDGTRWERDLASAAALKTMNVARAEARSSDPAAIEERYAELHTTLYYAASPWGRARIIESSAPIHQVGYVRGFTDPEPQVRAAAMAAIPEKWLPSHLLEIRQGLADPDVIVRTAAIEKYALAPMDTPAVKVAALREIERRERKEKLNDARIAAITAMTDVDRETAHELLELLKDPDPVVRRVIADMVETKYKQRRPDYTPLPATRKPAEYLEIARWAAQPHTATIHMTRGIVEVALLTQDAPITTWNFAQLAKAKYFDNSSFMRVVPNFVIQGGDPRNDMNGGPGYAIRDEINLQKYTRGAVGMALSGPDTGGSQFFITHSPQPHLDGGYTIFGRVYEGMTGVVDQTERGDRVETITIDEHAPVGQAEIDKVPPVSLPLEVGPIDPARMVARIPDYAQRRDSYKFDPTVVEMMKDYVHEGDRVEVFMGTWCDDSQREVPKFLRIMDELKTLGVSLPASFVAVDRSKQQPAALLANRHVEKVATFIYYRGDRELGRIVERPVGVFEDDLLALAAKQ